MSAGDAVEEGDPICVVSVDDHHAEVLSASAGRVAELLVGVDAPVAAGTTLVTFGPLYDPNDTSVAEVGEAEEAAVETPDPIAMAGFHSPAVRRLAAEHGIDLADVTGTGGDGRIRKEDVLSAWRALSDA